MALTPAPHVLSTVTITNATGSLLPVAAGIKLLAGQTKVINLPSVQLQEELVVRLEKLRKAGKVSYSLTPGTPADIGSNGGTRAMQDLIIRTSRRAVARCVVPTNQSITAYPVASNANANDSTLVKADDTILMINQTSTLQNGPWVVGVVSGGLAPLTRPTWWANGSLVLTGFEIYIDTGTVYPGYIFHPAFPGAVVGTNDPIFAAGILRGHVSLNGASPSVGLVTFTSYLLAGLGAEVAVVNQTTATNGLKAVLANVGPTGGTLTITGPNGAVDVVSYIVSQYGS